jgi:hypothetical protein
LDAKLADEDEKQRRQDDDQRDASHAVKQLEDVLDEDAQGVTHRTDSW